MGTAAPQSVVLVANEEQGIDVSKSTWIRIKDVLSSINLQWAFKTIDGDKTPYMTVVSQETATAIGQPFAKIFLKADAACTVTLEASNEIKIRPQVPASVTQAGNLIGLNIESQWEAAIGAGASGTVGGWDSTKTKAVWITVDPAAANGVWLQSANNAAKHGLYCAPGVPVKMTASYPAGGVQGKFFFYNPGGAAVNVYSLIEYVS